MLDFAERNEEAAGRVFCSLFLIPFLCVVALFRCALYLAL